MANDPGMCDAEVTLVASAVDNCAGSLPVVFEADLGSGFVPISNPFVFDLGTTTVRALATDTCGNTGMCEFTVTVLDTEPPTASAGRHRRLLSDGISRGSCGDRGHRRLG